MPTAEHVIAHAIRYTHRPGEEARTILQALADHGYTIQHTSEHPDLPAVTHMFAGATIVRRPAPNNPSVDLTVESPAATTDFATVDEILTNVAKQWTPQRR